MTANNQDLAIILEDIKKLSKRTSENVLVM